MTCTKEYKKNVNRDIVEAIKYKVRMLNWIDVLVLYAILLLVVKFLYEFLNYLGTPSLVTIVSIIAGLVAISVYLANSASENAIRTIDVCSEKLNTLLTTTRDIREIGYGDVLLENILECSVDAIGAERGSILFLEGNSLVFKLAIGYGMDKLSGFSILKTEGFAGWVLENGTVIRVNDVKDDNRFDPEVDRITDRKTDSILCAPLVLGSKTIGVLELVNKKDGPFSYEDEGFISYFADQAAIAISRTGFFESQKSYNLSFENLLKGTGNHIER